MSSPVLEVRGLTKHFPGRRRLLARVGEHEPARLSDIAAGTGVDVSTASRTAARLVEQGYIERVPDPADDRLRIIRLTPRGQKVDKEMQVIIERLEKRWAAQIGPRRFAQFRRTLVDLNAMIATGRSGSRARSR